VSSHGGRRSEPQWLMVHSQACRAWSSTDWQHLQTTAVSRMYCCSSFQVCEVHHIVSGPDPKWELPSNLASGAGCDRKHVAG